MIHDSNRAFLKLRICDSSPYKSYEVRIRKMNLRFPYKIPATLRIIPIIIRQHLSSSLFTTVQSLLKVLLTNLIPRPDQLSTNDEFHL
jgi:hypothetical protein